jgi:hypothetical protein
MDGNRRLAEQLKEYLVDHYIGSGFLCSFCPFTEKERAEGCPYVRYISDMCENRLPPSPSSCPWNNTGRLR